VSFIGPYSCWLLSICSAIVYSAPDDGRKVRPKYVEF